MAVEQYDQFLTVCAWICAAGAVLNLFLIRRRGTSAILMAVAFAVLAGILLALKIRASQTVIGVSAFALFALLVADFAIRARKRESRR